MECIALVYRGKSCLRGKPMTVQGAHAHQGFFGALFGILQGSLGRNSKPKRVGAPQRDSNEEGTNVSGVLFGIP